MYVWLNHSRHELISAEQHHTFFRRALVVPVVQKYFSSEIWIEYINAHTEHGTRPLNYENEQKTKQKRNLKINLEKYADNRQK